MRTHPSLRALLPFLLLLWGASLLPCSQAKPYLPKVINLGETSTAPPTKVSRDLKPINCIEDRQRAEQCQHIALHKIHKTGSGTLFTLLLLHAMSTNRTIDLGRHRPDDIPKDFRYDMSLDHLPIRRFAGWKEVRNFYKSRVKMPFKLIVPIREPLARFFSHVNFVQTRDFKNKTTDVILESARKYGNFVAKYYYGIDRHTYARDLIATDEFKEAIYVPSEYFDAGLVNVARTCGYRLECMAYVKAHDMTASKYLKRSITSEAVKVVDERNSLDAMLYQASLRQFERQLLALQRTTDLRNSVLCVQQMSDCFERISCPEISHDRNKTMRLTRFCSFFRAGDGARMALLSRNGKWQGPRVDRVWRLAISYCRRYSPSCLNVTHPDPIADRRAAEAARRESAGVELRTAHVDSGDLVVAGEEEKEVESILQEEGGRSEELFTATGSLTDQEEEEEQEDEADLRAVETQEEEEEKEKEKEEASRRAKPQAARRRGGKTRAEDTRKYRSTLDPNDPRGG